MKFKAVTQLSNQTHYSLSYFKNILKHTFNLPNKTESHSKLCQKTVSTFGSTIVLSLALLISGCNGLPTKDSAESKDLMLDKIKQTQVPQHQNTDITNDNLKQAITQPRYHANLWHVLSSDFKMSEQHMGKYKQALSFYSSRNHHIQMVTKRAEPYLYYIFDEVKRREMPYEIALLPAVESGFKASARSHMRAVGLWQFIPSTAEIFDLNRNWWYDGRKDVIKSTHAALDYLEKLYRLNDNDWLLALASYNAGLGNVYRAQKKYRQHNQDIENIESYQPNYWDIQPYLPSETRRYVPKLLAMAQVIKTAKQLGIEIEPLTNAPYFTKVELTKPVALNQVAKLSGADKADIALLNPAYERMATPPNGPFYVLLPNQNAKEFENALLKQPDIFNIVWQQHKIKSGDSLSVIAENYQTSTAAIRALNGMKNNRIRAGKTILIPIPADAYESVKSNGVIMPSQFAQTHIMTPKGQTYGYYQVKAGDTLWKLAKDYGVGAKAISHWNNVSLKTPLRIGQNLKIYSDKFGKRVVHTLQPGQSLWRVARKYGVSTDKLARWNNLSKNAVIQPGLKLEIWVKPDVALRATNGRYTVKPGDNLWVIARANKISAADLATHNQLSTKSLLKPGQILKIPSNI